MTDKISADFDSPWKEALDLFFEAFLALLFPELYRVIDWSRGYDSLDKELQQVVRESEVGRRYVDKLVRVWTKDGQECWALVHVEVQTARDDDFPLRMYVYNYRIFDRYNKAVTSIAVLADEDPNWRPNEFRHSQFGCDVGIRFPIAKLLDIMADEAALECQLSIRLRRSCWRHRGRVGDLAEDPESRQASGNPRLAGGLYERGILAAKDVRQLFLADGLDDGVAASFRGGLLEGSGQH